jgi:hypothetical protein
MHGTRGQDRAARQPLKWLEIRPTERASGFLHASNKPSAFMAVSSMLTIVTRGAFICCAAGLVLGWTGRSTRRRNLLVAVAIAALGFQAVHLSEHVIQLPIWALDASAGPLLTRRRVTRSPQQQCVLLRDHRGDPPTSLRRFHNRRGTHDPRIPCRRTCSADVDPGVLQSSPWPRALSFTSASTRWPRCSLCCRFETADATGTSPGMSAAAH